MDGRGAQAPLPTVYAWTLTSCSCSVRTGGVGSHRLTRLDSYTAASPTTPSQAGERGSSASGVSAPALLATRKRGGRTRPYFAICSL